MMNEQEKPLSEVSMIGTDRIEVAFGEDRRVVIDSSANTSIDASVAEDASLTMIVVGDVISDVFFARSVKLEKNAHVQLLLACRIEPGVTLRCDDVVRIVQDDAECTIDDRCVVEGNGKAILRQRVVIDPHVHRAKVSTAVHAMVLKNGRVRAIPELDIASNNVVAKHTVAIACPNPASIAYFASRGIDRGEAERVLAERLLCPISNLV